MAAGIEILDALTDRLPARPEVVAAVLVGSSAAPYADTHSDLDVELIVEGAAADLTSLCEAASLDLQVLTMAEMRHKAASPRDVDHWPYVQCRVLYDPDGIFERMLPELVCLRERDKAPRLRLHYFEFLFAGRHLARVMATGNELNARLSCATAVGALLRVVFVANGAYPPLPQWTSQCLHNLGSLPPQLGVRVLHLLRQPDVATVEALISAVDGWLSGLGFDFHHLKNELTREVTGERFRQWRERYGAW